nr:MAG TPA: Thymidylate kinase [Caudoviricetes sp.]
MLYVKRGFEDSYSLTDIPINIFAFEGADGAGKTQSISIIKKWLEENHVNTIVHVLSLPSSSHVEYKAIRSYLDIANRTRSESMTMQFKMLLNMKAAFADITRDVLKDSSKDHIILMDRSAFSTIAYSIAEDNGLNLTLYTEYCSYLMHNKYHIRQSETLKCLSDTIHVEDISAINPYPIWPYELLHYIYKKLLVNERLDGKAVCNKYTIHSAYLVPDITFILDPGDNILSSHCELRKKEVEDKKIDPDSKGKRFIDTNDIDLDKIFKVNDLYNNLSNCISAWYTEFRNLNRENTLRRHIRPLIKIECKDGRLTEEQIYEEMIKDIKYHISDIEDLQNAKAC